MPFDLEPNGCKSKLAYKRNHAHRSLGIEWPLCVASRDPERRKQEIEQACWYVGDPRPYELSPGAREKL